MTANIITIGNRESRRPAGPNPVFIKTFDGRKDLDFSALNDAETYLADRGFSFGPGCNVSHRSAIVYGRCWRLPRWNNMTALEQQQAHGVIEGERRRGPITIKVFFHAPGFAIAAVSSPQVAGSIITAWANQR